MWFYKNEIIDSLDKLPKGVWGFVYKITCIDNGKFYIGKKQFWSERNIKLNKKELIEAAALKKPGKKPTKKFVVLESDWLRYAGSEPEIKKDVKEMGLAAFKREILHLCYTKKELTYSEIKYQFQMEVLEREDTYNSNIEGRYFKSDFVKNR